jgi:hypothetical protein
MTLSVEVRPPNQSPSVIAGLKCAPEICPTALCHRHHSKAKGQRDTNEPNSQPGIGCGNYCAATTSKGEPKGAKKFSNEACAHLHSQIPLTDIS